MTSSNELIQRADRMIIKYLNKCHLKEKERQEARIQFLGGLEKEVGFFEGVRGREWGQMMSSYVYSTYTPIYDVKRKVRISTNKEEVIRQHIIQNPKTWGTYIGVVVGMLEFRSLVTIEEPSLFPDITFLRECVPKFYKYVEESAYQWKSNISKVKEKLRKRQLYNYKYLIKEYGL